MRSLKGDPRAPDVLDVSPSFAAAGANEGLYAKFFTKNFNKVPRAMKDGRGFWLGDYWGVTSFGVNTAVVQNIPEDVAGPAQARVQEQGGPQRQSAHVRVGAGGRVRRRNRERRLAVERRPGDRLLREAEVRRNFILVQATPQTIASGQTPITIDWDYLNLAYGKEFPSAKIKTSIPSDGVYGAYYCQAINATGPHPWAARLWQEFIYSDQGQLLS